MKTVGLFEAKTKFSEICQAVVDTGETVLVTRRGEPLVKIEPADHGMRTIRERRAAYMAEHSAKEPVDEKDFEPAPRSSETSAFQLEG